MAEMQEIITKKRPGDKITITYLRNKEKITKTVTLKNAQGNTKVVKKVEDLDVLGASFRPVTAKQKEAFDIKYGLEVTNVGKGAIKNAGINKGFIMISANDAPLKSIGDLQEVVKQASTSKDPIFVVKGIWPTGKRDYVVIKLSE